MGRRFLERELRLSGANNLQEDLKDLCLNTEKFFLRYQNTSSIDEGMGPVYYLFTSCLIVDEMFRKSGSH